MSLFFAVRRKWAENSGKYFLKLPKKYLTKFDLSYIISSSKNRTSIRAADAEFFELNYKSRERRNFYE